MSREFQPYHLGANLFLWLDGSDIFANDQASVPADGDQILKWHDKSVNGYIFEATSANAPTYNATNKKIVFDGTEHLACTGISNFPTTDVANQGGFHAFVAGSLTNVNDSQTDVIFSGKTSDASGDFEFVKESGNNISCNFQYKNTSGGSVNVASATSVTSGQVCIFEVLVSGASNFTIPDVNNANNYSVGVLAALKEATDLFIGRNTQSDEQESNMEIHEILMFYDQVQFAQRRGIQGYLKHKYNLPDSTLLAGLLNDDASTPASIHPFFSISPKVASSVPVTASTSQNLPDIFNGEHKKASREPITFVRLSLTDGDTNVNDGIISRGGIKQHIFTQEDSFDTAMFFSKSYPCLTSVSTAPIEIIPTKGVSLRGSVTVKLRDFTLPSENISFFAKFLAQNPFYLGRRIEIYEGFKSSQIVGALSEKLLLAVQDGRRSYVIDSMTLTGGFLQIKAKDPLTLADDLKSRVPEPSDLDLGSEITGTTIHTKNITSVTDANPSAITSTSHGFVTGDRVRIAGTSLSSLDNKTFTVTVTSSSEFTVPVASGGTGNSGTATKAYTLKRNGSIASSTIVNEKFSTSGFVRINEEILKFIRNSNEDSFVVNGRGEWGTISEEHEADDSVQVCVFFGDYANSNLGQTVDVVANDLLVNKAGIPSEAINASSGGLYSWADERSRWLASFPINLILSEPKSVSKQLSDVGGMVGVNFFYDDFAGKIIMKAEAPELDLTTLNTITDDDIILDSFKLINSEKERVSRVYYYYALKNSVEDRNKPKNYRKLFVNINSDSESAAQYGVQSNKVIFGYGVSDTSTATSVSQRYLGRFKQTPITCSFQVDKSTDYIQTGDHFFLSTKHILNADGLPKPKTEMQCLSVKYDSLKQTNTIKAKTFRFASINSGKIVNNRADIQTAGSGYKVGETLGFSGGSGANFACEVTEIQVSGQFKNTAIVKTGHVFEVDTTGSTVFFNVGDKLFYTGISNPSDPTGDATSLNRSYAIIKSATAIDGSNTQTITIDADISTVNNDSFTVLSTESNSSLGAVTDIKITNNGNSSYLLNEILTENSGSSGSGFQVKINHLQSAFATIGGGTGTEEDAYTGLRATESYISTDTPIGSANGGANSRFFITLERESAGSGYNNADPQTFTQSAGEITTSGNGTGLVFTVTISGGSIGTNFIVTSNPQAGSNIGDAGNKGFSADPTNPDILFLDESGDSGSGASVKVSIASKMSIGSEPYLIV